jgi:hypothetical protein
MPKTEKKPTQIDILEKFRNAQGLNKSEFPHQLGVGRASYYTWMDGAEISLEILITWALDYVGGWVGAMAVELITLRDPRLVPCVCQTAIGDAGPCPRHAVEVAA